MSATGREKNRRRRRLGQRTFGFDRAAGPRKRLGKRLGRKRSKDSGVTHGARPALKTRIPVHITLKWCSGLPTLRDTRVGRTMSRIFRTVNGGGWLRIVHYSIQHNHLHMICEVKGGMTCSEGTELSPEATLSRQIQGMKVRIARGLNRLWGRAGTVFSDRFHRQDLTSPKQVRNAIRYVLQNVFRHSSLPDDVGEHATDPHSSGRWFSGWKESRLAVTAAALADAPVLEPETWLLSVGWKGRALLSIDERPARS